MRTLLRTVAAVILLSSAAGCGDDEAVELKRQIDATTAEARALLHTEGCAAASGCAAAAVGAKACGGPREYWVYCREKTQESDLLAKLEAVKKLEQRYNELTHAVSTCSLAIAPESFSLVDGKCTAAASAPGPQ